MSTHMRRTPSTARLLPGNNSARYVGQMEEGGGLHTVLRKGADLVLWEVWLESRQVRSHFLPIVAGPVLLQEVSKC